MALLETQGLSKAFGGLRAVNELDLRVELGEIVGMIGPNGSGKTTVFNLITGIYRSTAGRMTFLGRDGSRPTWPGARRTPSPRSASPAPSRTSGCSTR